MFPSPINMQQTLKLIRSSLAGIYPAGEIEGFIRLIFDALCQYTMTDLLLRRDENLAPELVGEIVSIVERLKQHEPIQYILGQAYFGELSMTVGRGVLIPRPETAEMVQLIVSQMGDIDGRVADICTGSGCIAIALAHHWRKARVEGWDISPDALAYARNNGVGNNVEVEWRECDVLTYEPQEIPRYKVIVSNPPYVLDSERIEIDDNVLHHEPHIALFVPDDDALRFYRAIAHIAMRELLPGGVLYCEINASQGDACKKLLNECGFEQVAVFSDFMGAERVLKGVKPILNLNC